MRYSLYILVFFTLSKICGQQATDVELPMITPPSPEAQSIQKYGDIPVSAYTGVPQISIPIYAISDGDLQVPIDLSYHASGIRVSEEASWVGLGWTLNTGGAIVRTILGEGDIEHNYFDLLQQGVPAFTSSVPQTNSVSPYVHVGCDIPLLGISDPCVHFGNTNVASTSPPFPFDDFEPDRYNYSFPGGGGKYILDRNGNAFLEKKENVLVEYVSSSNSWNLTDDRGFKYEYAASEKTKPNATGQLEVTTAWYLTKITSPTNRVVTYNYVSDTDYDMIRISNTNESRVISACAAQTNSLSATSQSTQKNQTLSSIDFANGQIQFQYDENRLDLDGGKKLNAIEVYRKDTNGVIDTTPFKKIEMSYGYFQGNNDSFNTYLHPFTDDQINKRLRLETVSEVSNTGPDTIPYQFTYYETFQNGLPSKVSFAQDYWGYYTGRTGSNHLVSSLNRVLNLGGFQGGDPDIFQSIDRDGQNRRVAPDYTHAFALKKIVYPTGGSSTFVYEPNDHDPTKSIPLGYSDVTNAQFNFEEQVGTLNGIRGNQTIMALDLTQAKVESDGKVYLTLDYTFRCLNTANGCNDPFGQDQGDDVYFSVAQNSDGSGEISGSRVRLTDGTFCFDSNNPLFVCDRDPKNLQLLPAVYYLVGNWENHVDLSGMSMNYTYLKPGDGTIEEAFDDPYGGGLRIKEIIDEDLNGGSYHRKFEYQYQEDRDQDGTAETYSYGRLMGIPEDIRWQVDVDYGLLTLGYSSIYCKKFIQSANSNAPLNVNGSIVGYDQVNVLHGKSTNGTYGIIGRTTYKYQNEVRPVSFEGTRPSNIPNINISSNGLLLEQTEFKYDSGQYEPVREVVNTYDFESIGFQNPTQAVGSSVFYGVKKRDMNVVTTSAPTNAQIQLHKNSVFTYVYPVLHSEWIKLLSTTEKSYDSNGDDTKVTQTTNYFYDNPFHRQVTRTETLDSKGNSVQTKTYFSEDVDSATALGAENLSSTEISAIDRLKIPTSSDPNRLHQLTVPIQVETTINGKKTIQRTLYEDWGNDLVLPDSVLTLKGDHSATNKMQARIAFHDYDGKGNVSRLSKANGPSMVYIWGYDGAYPIAKIENATHAQIASALGTTETAVKAYDETDLATIDGLRSSLPTAMVTTYTYEPLIGVTSITDPRGYTTHYTYDGFNRLKEVRDADNLLIEDYKYQYKTQD